MKEYQTGYRGRKGRLEPTLDLVEKQKIFRIDQPGWGRMSESQLIPLFPAPCRYHK